MTIINTIEEMKVKIIELMYNVRNFCKFGLLSLKLILLMLPNDIIIKIKLTKLGMIGMIKFKTVHIIMIFIRSPN